MEGKIGHLWFLNALSLLAIDDKNIKGEVLSKKCSDFSKEESYYKLLSQLWPVAFQHFGKFGIYVIRIYKNNGWRYVIIDDRIPCVSKAHSD